MKNPPTLADACIATALDKRLAKSAAYDDELRNMFRRVGSAHRFVLDEQMSAYLFDLSHSFWTGGLRKRNHLLENARRMARLPHQRTWIEFDYLAYLRHAKHRGVTIDRPGARLNEPLPPRVGWLLQQHAKIDAAFIATEMVSNILEPTHTHAHIQPVSIIWCSDGSPLPWRTIKLWRDERDQGQIVLMDGYHSSQVAWTHTFSESLSTMLMDGIGSATPNGLGLKPAIPIRDLWALLATINDLPVTIENVEPTKGYVARGSYKKFLKHSVIHLTVPETQWRRLALKTATSLKRRAHQVRGHWRRDWRNPLNRLCEHEFDEQMVCRRCQGRQLWIAEHQRGDASIGFVTHDYEVHHNKEA